MRRRPVGPGAHHGGDVRPLASSALHQVRAAAAAASRVPVRGAGAATRHGAATVPGALFDMPVAGPIVIPFDEDVNGITSRSMPAFRVTGRLPEPRVSGQWACFDADAAETDCRTGAVREASFQPDEPLRATATYSFAVNPVHVLALTDLAGNPALPRSAIGVSTSAERAFADSTLRARRGHDSFAGALTGGHTP